MEHFHSFKTKLQTTFGLTLPKFSTALIWLIGFAGLFALTIRDFLPLLADYTQNNVATQVEIIVIDGFFKPPQPLLCLPHYKNDNQAFDPLMEIANHILNGTISECEDCRVLAAMKWDVWNEINFTEFSEYGIRTYYQILSLALSGKVIRANDSAQEAIFRDPDSPMHLLVLSALVNFFVWKTRSDYYLSYTSINDQIDIWNVFDIDNTTSAKVDSLLAATLERICRGIQFAELDFAHDFVPGTPVNRSCLDVLLHGDVPSELGMSGLWTALPALDKPRLREYRYTFSGTESLSKDLFFPKPGVKAKPIWLYPDVAMQYLSVLDPLVSPQMYRTPLTPGIGHRITVRYTILMRSKETRPTKACYNGTTITVCLTKCTKQVILQQCGCVPFSIHMGLEYPPGTAYCTSAMYNVCNLSRISREELHEEILDECFEKCQAACEYTTYSWQMDYEQYETQNPDSTEVTLRMAPMFSTFAELSWTYKSMPEQFMSQIFGIVNFYLGFSGLSLLAIVVACVSAVQNLRKRGSTAAEGQLPFRREAATGAKRDWTKEEWFVQLKEIVKSEVKDEIRRNFWVLGRRSQR